MSRQVTRRHAVSHSPAHAIALSGQVMADDLEALEVAFRGYTLRVDAWTEQHGTQSDKDLQAAVLLMELRRYCFDLLRTVAQQSTNTLMLQSAYLAKLADQPPTAH